MLGAATARFVLSSISPTVRAYFDLAMRQTFTLVSRELGVQ